MHHEMIMSFGIIFAVIMKAPGYASEIIYLQLASSSHRPRVTWRAAFRRLYIFAKFRRFYTIGIVSIKLPLRQSPREHSANNDVPDGTVVAVFLFRLFLAVTIFIISSSPLGYRSELVFNISRASAVGWLHQRSLAVAATNSMAASP